MIPAALLSALTIIGPPLFHAAEHAFSGKSKSGEDKMGWALQAAHWFVESLVRSDAPLPNGTKLPADAKISETDLKTAMETVFQQVKNSGQLTAPDAGLFLIHADSANPTITKIK